jgi:hypothetical protein
VTPDSVTSIAYAIHDPKRCTGVIITPLGDSARGGELIILPVPIGRRTASALTC